MGIEDVIEAQKSVGVAVDDPGHSAATTMIEASGGDRMRRRHGIGELPHQFEGQFATRRQPIEQHVLFEANHVHHVIDGPSRPLERQTAARFPVMPAPRDKGQAHSGD